MSALGYTLQLPTEERFLNSKEELQGQIATLLGGRSAEEIVFGKITTGAANDLQRATDLAEQMVGTYGMSDTLGPLAYDKQGGGRFLGGNNNPRRSVSDATAQAIDKECAAGRPAPATMLCVMVRTWRCWRPSPRRFAKK